MDNLSVTAPEHKSHENTTDWWVAPKADPLDKEVVIMAPGTGVGLPVALVLDQTIAEAVVASVNNHEALISGLQYAALYLGKVIRGESSLKEAVDAVVEIENIIKLAGGSI